MKGNIVEFKENYKCWWITWKRYLNEGKFDKANGMVSGLFMANIIDCKLYYKLTDYILYKECFQKKMTPAEFAHSH